MRHTRFNELETTLPEPNPGPPASRRLRNSACERKPFQSILLALLLLPHCTLPASAAEKRARGWSYEQTHRYFGNFKATLCGKGVLLKSLQTDIELVCLKPSWTVMVYSPKRKIAHSRALSKTARAFMYNPYTTPNKDQTSDIDLPFKGILTYAGLQAKAYGSPCYDLKGNLNYEPASRKAEYAVTKDFGVAREISQFLCKFLDHSTIQDVPLRFVYFGQPQSYGMGLKYNKASLSFASTEIIGKIVELPTEPKLAYPVGYKSVELSEVTFGQKKKELENLRHLFGD